jgi:ectoine hydroxylase-related dioxygenase (phytanoyl-CoA dioxygenase family)
MTDTLTKFRYRLTNDEVSHYNSQGYVLHNKPVLPAGDFSRLKAIFEEDLLKYGDADLDTIHFRDARLLEFLLGDAVLDLVEPLIGPNIGLWSSHFISKAPRVGKATPWHEDSSYWNGRVSTMEGICTVWLAIDEATPENGCMRVIPGSQHGGFSEYEAVETAENIFDSQIKPELIKEDDAVYFALKPNECSLHEARIIHGAKANTSDMRRAGYTMRYFPTTSKVYPEKNLGHKLWLARGRDIAGNVYEN